MSFSFFFLFEKVPVCKGGGLRRCFLLPASFLNYCDGLEGKNKKFKHDVILGKMFKKSDSLGFSSINLRNLFWVTCSSFLRVFANVDQIRAPYINIDLAQLLYKCSFRFVGSLPIVANQRSQNPQGCQGFVNLFLGIKFPRKSPIYPCLHPVHCDHSIS